MRWPARALPGKRQWSSCLAPRRLEVDRPLKWSNGVPRIRRQKRTSSLACRARPIRAVRGFADTLPLPGASGLDRRDVLGNRHSVLLFLMTSSEGPQLLRRVEQSLLPGGGPDDGRPAQMTARVAHDQLAELLGKPDDDALRPADGG